MKKIKVIAYVLMAFSFLFVLSTVYAYRGDVSKIGPNYNPVLHNEIQTAIKEGNFQKWKEIVSKRDNNSKITKYITEENFEEYRKAYLDAISGNPEKLKEFRNSLGLDQGNQYRKSNNTSQNYNSGFKKMNRFNLTN